MSNSSSAARISALPRRAFCCPASATEARGAGSSLWSDRLPEDLRSKSFSGLKITAMRLRILLIKSFTNALLLFSLLQNSGSCAPGGNGNTRWMEVFPEPGASRGKHFSRGLGTVTCCMSVGSKITVIHLKSVTPRIVLPG